MMHSSCRQQVPFEKMHEEVYTRWENGEMFRDTVSVSKPC
jgi:hypothetical protein